jgi:hypothetical protein
VDPISAIGVATTAYNAIKKGFQVGKEKVIKKKKVGLLVLLKRKL